MTGRKRLYLATAIIFGLFTNISYFISDASADPLSIGYTSRQMSVIGGSDSSQTLTASGGTGPYTWSIPGGSGTLSTSNGSSTVYTAPSSNPNRANDPIIRLTDSTGRYVNLTMAVNGYPYSVEAVRISAEPWCNTVGVVSSCGMTTYHYDCHGDLMAPPHYFNPNPCFSTTNSVWGCDYCLNSSLICDN
jgi:hypothetical protein